MPIKQIFGTQEDVPEFLKGAVAEQDGKWIFEAETVAEVKNLKDTLKTERDRRVAKESELKRFDKFKEVKDEDWDSYQEWLQSRDSDHEEQGEGKDGKSQKGWPGQLEKAIAKEKQRFERQLEQERTTIKERDTKITELERTVREFTIWTPVRDLAIKHKVLPDRLDAFVTLLKTQGRFDLDENGKLIFKDGEGYPTTQKPEEAFKQALKEEFAWAFEGTGAGGSGASQGNKSGLSSQDLSKLSAVERLKYARRQQQGQ